MTTMINKRVFELEGAQLDWAVGLALGWDANHDGKVWHRVGLYLGPFAIDACDWKPSSEWRQGGPIIERERIWLAAPTSRRSEWSAAVDESTDAVRGPTPLIAAMRAFVAKKLGDEVDVPQ